MKPAEQIDSCEPLGLRQRIQIALDVWKRITRSTPRFDDLLIDQTVVNDHAFTTISFRNLKGACVIRASAKLQKSRLKLLVDRLFERRVLFW